MKKLIYNYVIKDFLYIQNEKYIFLKFNKIYLPFIYIQDEEYIQDRKKIYIIIVYLFLLLLKGANFPLILLYS